MSISAVKPIRACLCCVSIPPLHHIYVLNLTFYNYQNDGAIWFINFLQQLYERLIFALFEFKIHRIYNYFVRLKIHCENTLCFYNEFYILKKSMEFFVSAAVNIFINIQNCCFQKFIIIIISVDIEKVLSGGHCKYICMRKGR